MSDGIIPGIVFSPTYVEGEDLAHRLSEMLGTGVPFVSGKMPKGERTRIAEVMRTSPSSCPVVVATTVWSTGIDIPCLRWVVPMEGQAPIRLLQSSGRSMRPKPGGTTYEVIDVVASESPNGLEHAARRREHYEEAGVGGAASGAARLLQRSRARAAARVRARARQEPIRPEIPRSQPGRAGPRTELQAGPSTAGLLWSICGPPDREANPYWRLVYIIVAIVAFCISLKGLIE